MKRIKQLLASILTLAMIFSMMNVASVEAVKDAFDFKEENTYALISNTNNKAIYIHNINWGNNDTKADGDYSKSGKVLSNSLLKITQLEDQSGADSSNGEVKVKLDMK